MGDGSLDDLRSVDGEVARGFALLERWRSSLALDASSAAGEAPLDAVRRVTGKTTFVALGELDPPVSMRPLRDALRTWVYYLLQARVGQIEEVAWAQAAQDASGRVEGQDIAPVDWRHAWRGVVSASVVVDARRWLDTACQLAPPLAAVAARRGARRVEVARRLGLDHPWRPLVDVAPEALAGAAERILDGTEDIWKATLPEMARTEAGAAGVIHGAVAREAGEGWPARLSPRWLRDVLPGAFAGPAVVIPALPPAFGAASFTRALRAFGHALGVTPPSSSVPFALARRPAFVPAHRLGFLLAALPSDPVFQSRALGLSRRVASAQARTLARSALFEVRLLAVRLLLGDDARPAPPDRFDELGARLFGRAPDARLRGAWPAPREDEPAIFLGLLQTPRSYDALRQRHDADWFRNPRAWQELRSVSPEPPLDDKEITSAPDDLRRAFEGALA
jgi:hypothetical protein